MSQTQRLAVVAMLIEHIECGLSGLRRETDARAIVRRAERLRDQRETLDDVMAAIILSGGAADRDAMSKLTEPIAAIDESEWLAHIHS